MTKFKIGTQMNLIFATVTVISSIIFLYIIRVSFTAAYQNQSAEQLRQFHDEMVAIYNDTGRVYNFSRFNGYILLIDGELEDSGIINRNSIMIITEEKRALIIEEVNQDTETQGVSELQKIDQIGYIFSRFEYQDTIVTMISITDTKAYIQATSGNVLQYATLAFANIFILGNIIVWVFSRNVVAKLQSLTNAVEKMAETNYAVAIDVEGEDEISDLARSIEKLRSEISINELTKQEMMQNIGHDLKTPIAVIRSYAEAIIDGVIEPAEAQTIIEQSDDLTNRVLQLLELSRIGYLEITDKIVEIPLKNVITEVVDNYKYTTNAQFYCDLDDSTYPIIAEHLYTALANIIDNAIRYAKTQIVINLENKKITIFNDGDHIEEQLIPKIFQPYEKGYKGQFGLGMSIAKRALNNFHLSIKVENVENGVLFTIEPI